MKQRTEIEIELSETVAYIRKGGSIEADCAQCGMRVQMTTPQLGATLAGCTEREIFRSIEAGTVHFVEAGVVLVCLKSLTGTLSQLSAVDEE